MLKNVVSLLAISVGLLIWSNWGIADPYEFSKGNAVQVSQDHLNYAKRKLLYANRMCEQIRPISKGNNFDAGITRIKVHDDEYATVLQMFPECDKKGNLWSALGSVYTLLIVGDQVFETWLFGTPKSLDIDDNIYLLLPIDDTQCGFDDPMIQTLNQEPCYSLYRWDLNQKSFYGHSNAISFLEYVSN